MSNSTSEVTGCIKVEAEIVEGEVGEGEVRKGEAAERESFSRARSAVGDWLQLNVRSPEISGKVMSPAAYSRVK